MARFQFNLPRRLDPATFGCSHAAVSSRALRSLGLWPDSESTDGPGWFDSSWDLVRGLEVREGVPDDAPLEAWLQACVAAPPHWTRASTLAQGHEQPGAGLVPAPPHGAFGDALQFGDLDLGVATEVAHLDDFGQFGIEGLELA